MKWWFDWGYDKVFIELEDGRKYSIRNPFSIPHRILKKALGLPDDFPDDKAVKLAVELGLSEFEPFLVALHVMKVLEKFKEEILEEIRKMLKEVMKSGSDRS